MAFNACSMSILRNIKLTYESWAGELQETLVLEHSVSSFSFTGRGASKYLRALLDFVCRSKFNSNEDSHNIFLRVSFRISLSTTPYHIINMKTIEILTAALVNLSLTFATPFPASASASVQYSASSTVIGQPSTAVANGTTSATPSAPALAATCPSGNSAPVTTSSHIYRYHKISPDGEHPVCGYYWLDIQQDGKYQFGGKVHNFSGSKKYWLGLGTVFEDAGNWAYTHKKKCIMSPGRDCDMSWSGQSSDIQNRWPLIYNNGNGYKWFSDKYEVDPVEGNVDPDPLLDDAIAELPAPPEEIDLDEV